MCHPPKTRLLMAYMTVAPKLLVAPCTFSLSSPSRLPSFDDAPFYTSSWVILRLSGTIAGCSPPWAGNKNRESRLRRRAGAKRGLHLRRRPAANNRQGVIGNEKTKKQIEGQGGEIRGFIFSGSALSRVCDTEVVATCRDYCLLIHYAWSLL